MDTTPSGRGTTALLIERPGYHLHAEAIAPDRAGAPWIVFGNSLVTDLSIWDAQAAALAGRYGILRYDQVGHGQSGLPAYQPGFDDLAADLLAVMDAAGVDRAIYDGLSMGIPTGLAAHRQAAHRFAGFVFTDGQAKTAPGGAANWAERIAAAEANGMQSFAAATAERWLTAGAAPEMRARLVAMIAATPLEGFRIGATALMDYDFADELQHIACPTLLVAGEADTALAEGMAAKLKPAIAGSVLHLVPQAGHVPCFEQPDAYTGVLDGFLGSLAPDA
ncbi:MAG: alpha/beta fold hydrolase [Rhodospirillaceae bacterium]|nr:alpha/beta fold hydrolase [Rhodospirillaceae bacterium]MCA8932960.1 alpha/beta fold hydrolase [Rhodospirillaceae bacterium]